MNFTCDHCGCQASKDEKYVNYARKRKKKLFCSAKCLNAWRSRDSVDVFCGSCGTKIYRTLSQLSRSKSGISFCSRRCATVRNNSVKSGKNNPNYRTGIWNYRKMALSHYGEACVVCGYSVEKVLQVHHIDTDRTNNSLENLLVVCPTHHVEFHFGVKDVKNFRRVELSFKTVS